MERDKRWKCGTCLKIYEWRIHAKECCYGVLWTEKEDSRYDYSKVTKR